MTVYIGIDPSLTHTGIVALGYTDPNGNPLGLLWAHTIKTKPDADADWRKAVARRSSIALAIMAYLHEFRAVEHLVCVEGYAPNAMRMGASIAQIELGAILRASLNAHEMSSEGRVEFVPPASLKKFATGKGNADKLTVATALMKRFGVDFSGDDNLWDAYGLARLIAAAAGHRDGITADQYAVASKAVSIVAEYINRIDLS
jgi:crossover junction endodeoxyribonuclease RuvC